MATTRRSSRRCVRWLPGELSAVWAKLVLGEIGGLLGYHRGNSIVFIGLFAVPGVRRGTV